jgi:hypothetical protein
VKSFLFLLLILVLLPLPGRTQEQNESLDSILDGFDPDVTLPGDGPEPVAVNPESPLELYARAQVLSGIWMNDIQAPAFEEKAGAVSNLKLSLDLNLEFQHRDWTFFSDAELSHDFAASVNGGSGYTDAYVQDLEKNAELKELWVEKNMTPSIDIKVGRQIVSWGTSNTLRIIDVLNPLDNRWPGMTDIENRRLPVAMTRINFYSEKTDASLIAVHEVRTDKNPVFGSPFFEAAPDPAPEKESSSLGNTQFGACLNSRFRGLDAGVYGAAFFDQDAWNGEYPFVKMAGTACTLARGNFLFKAEGAWILEKKYTNAQRPEKNRLDVLGGIEYTGFRNSTIVAEWRNRHIFDFETQMEEKGLCRNEVSGVFKAETEFFNDTLCLSLLSSFNGVSLEKGGFIRLKATYDYTDTVKFEAGGVFYYGGENSYYDTIRENDLLFFKLVFDINGV